MADAPADALGMAAQGMAAILTAVGSFLLGRYQARTKAVAVQQSGEHKEREQLFNHYNELITATREMNHTLRNELNLVRTQMTAMQMEHQQTLLAAAKEREDCRVENERLRAELKSVKEDVKELKAELRDQG